MQTTNIKKQIAQAIDTFEGVTRALYAGVGILNVVEQEEIKFAESSG